MTPAAVRAIEHLAAHHVMTLATHGEEGPWAAAVFYVHEGFELYFASSPRARHSRNLEANPAAAATVHGDCVSWQQIKGVQLEGVVEALSGDEAARVQALYARKFPVARIDGSAPAPIANALSRVTWYRFSARKAFFLDNAVGFGKREAVLP